MRVALTRPPWQDKAKAKVTDLKSRIPKEWILDSHDVAKAEKQRDLTDPPFIEQFLNDQEKDIIQNDSVRLVERIKARQYSAVEVTKAYCKTAAIAQQINNCLHEVIFDFALRTAKELDRSYAETGKVKGPLHGLPVSLKDQFHVEGYDTTMGYVGWIGTFEGDPNSEKLRKMNSQIVKELLSLGAVLYCKTSVPQTLSIGETTNNIIGTTFNPVNMNLSCGGSSGGEAALQALKGSSVGLGTDIGGSVRGPAGFCGTYAIKPTVNRLSYRDVANTNPGQDTHASSMGVMGASIDAVKLVLTSLLSTEPWIHDPSVVRMPWNYDVVASTLARADSDGSANTAQPLKIGFYPSDGVVTPHPPVTRGMKSVQETLTKLGHAVVDWNPPPHATASQIQLAFLTADGFHDVYKQLELSGEPLIPQLQGLFELRDPTPLLEYQDLTLQGKEFSEQYSDYWNSTGNSDGRVVDVVIMPVAPHAAVIPGKFFHEAYTDSINLLDYSAAVVPVTKADKTIDRFDDDYKPLNETDRKNWEAYDPEIYDGAPVGLQIVARKWEEEKVWAVAKIIDAALKERAGKL